MEKSTPLANRPGAEEATVKIQRAWRSYVDRRIFQYIKKVLLNKLST